MGGVTYRNHGKVEVGRAPPRGLAKCRKSLENRVCSIILRVETCILFLRFFPLGMTFSESSEKAGHAQIVDREEDVELDLGTSLKISRLN